MNRWFSIPGQGSRLTGMEGLRAYAAAIVFMFHAALLMREHAGIAGPIVDWMLHSQYGVDIFFILSGYLIAGLVSKPNFFFSRYLRHRIARIYPAFLGTIIAFLFAVIIVCLNGAFGLGVRSINYVTWSLFFEFCFYLTFPLMYRYLGLARTMIVCAIIIVALGHVDMRFVRFAYFFAGVWLRLRSSAQPWASEPVAITLYLVVTTATIHLQKYVLFVALYLPAATLLVDHALHTKGLLHRILSQRGLRSLGNISYSFYLLQPIGLLAARYAIGPLKLTGTAWCLALLTTGFSLTCLLASASFIAFERPYFKYRHPFADRRVSNVDVPPIVAEVKEHA